MVTLYGERRTRRELSAYAGSLSQFAGVRLMTLGDGVERGVRMLEFRTGTGLRFSVLIDRAMDIGDCEHNGMAIGWHSPTGFRHPSLHEYEGEGGLGWMRSFSGLLVTCGLDHTLFMAEEPADHYNYAPRQTVRHSIHGRVGTIPARLTGYGERWDGDDCWLWCEGVVRQAAVFGEHLELTRRIEAKVGTDEIRISDRVANRGFSPTPHMYMYHVNVGHPVLSEGSRYAAPIRDVLWAAHSGERYRAQGVGYDRLPPPQERFHEQVWEHDVVADETGRVPVALVNEGIGLGLEVTFRKDQFPCLFEWQALQSGLYALGIEPSTDHVIGRGRARDTGELIWLGHGDERRYDVSFHILAGQSAVQDSIAKIAAIARQPSDGYPEPSGQFPCITRTKEEPAA